MKRSTKGILTSHTGSLPRPQELRDLLLGKEAGQPVSAVTFDAAVRRSIAEVVNHQAEVGIDVPSDGEMSKISYGWYAKDRINGFGGEVTTGFASIYATEFPEWAARNTAAQLKRPSCNGPASP